MKQSKSSKSWLNEHFKDKYVKLSKKDGLRSRAAYKLTEIQEKYKLITSGNVVVELGAAPGGWTQVVRNWVGESGTVIALDVLPMKPMAGVEILTGDFSEDDVLSMLEGLLNGRKVDVVLSDMAPNMSGIKNADQAKSMYLIELVLEFAKEHLTKQGSMFIKAFHGPGIDQYIRELRQVFSKVSIHKPDASRQRSREVYLLASKLK